MTNNRFVLIRLMSTCIGLFIILMFLKINMPFSIPKNFNFKSNDTPDPTSMPTFNNILKRPNEFVLKYVNLPYDYKYGSNSIPLAISSLICDGDLLELGMVIRFC